MRRKIELYIGGEKADLSDQSFVLFNYAQTDVMKPTAVKNSFTKQVTLPGSPANDAIFATAARSMPLNNLCLAIDASVFSFMSAICVYLTSDCRV